LNIRYKWQKWTMNRPSAH